MRARCAVVLLLLSTSVAKTSFAAVTFEWVTVGDPGNPADEEVMIDGTTGYGSVDYTYRISKHEVTNSQYVEFLNAVARTDTNSLFNNSMSTRSSGGITRSGAPGSWSYAVKADAVGMGPGGSDYTYSNKPVNFVSYFDAMRFVNWLEHGQPTGLQDTTTTEDGVYSISDGVREVRAPGARYAIPAEDEWYKAAYYDPASDTYFDFPTSTDSMPDNNLPSADTGNSANFLSAAHEPFIINSDYTTGNPFYPLTDVGAYTLSHSPYGTFDQGGNVHEWDEAVITIIRPDARGVRGGSWTVFDSDMAASARVSALVTIEIEAVGFRVVHVPEPDSFVVALIATCVLSVCLRVP